jgi:hypothetical protein
MLANETSNYPQGVKACGPPILHERINNLNRLSLSAKSKTVFVRRF